MKKYQQVIEWYSCKIDPPPIGQEVLLYCEDLLDTILASRRASHDGFVTWVESYTGNTITSPLSWAEKPIPE